MTPKLTLEIVFRDRRFAAMPASPLQVAICQGANGERVDLGELAEHFGVDDLDGCERPQFVALVCGRGAGKSLLAACAAIAGALSADCRKLRVWDVPRFAIVAPDIDLATATYSTLRGVVEASEWLSSRLVGKPTADTLVLRRDDGRHVEIKVVAASVGGRTVRARWLCGFVLDECCHFGQEASGHVVNAESILDAASKRLLPGAQGWLTSTPNGPQGLLYTVWGEHFGKPGRWLVVRAPTRALNPSFDQRQIDAAYLENPDHAAREYGAEWTDAEAALIPAEALDACTTREGDAPRLLGATYVAAIDPATRGNAWTLAIATNTVRDGVVIALVREWIGSKRSPLDPCAVLAEIRTHLAAYGVGVVETDQFAGDFLVALARREGVAMTVWNATSAENYALADDLRSALVARRVELPRDVHVRADLLGARRTLTQAGPGLRIPVTADGRHGDYVPSVTRAHKRASAVRPWEAPQSRDEARDMEANALQVEARRMAARKGAPWRR